jgi:hypothetical protein
MNSSRLIFAPGPAKCKAELPLSTQEPQQIIVRLGEDFNWWLSPTPGEAPIAAPLNRGVLDPRQVRHLIEQLEEYRADGVTPEEFAQAFQFYAVDAELAEGILQLERSAPDLPGEGGDLFALPVVDEDGDGRYVDFLDALSEAHVRKLNATHHYARPCTADEMRDELEAVDRDRFFSAEIIHVFEEINQILEWRPAEWDDPES